ncbi:MAG TPA: cobalamin-binding protein, partial [bacterium]|nr:cobalamin-binding protein [bacterium]
GGTVKAIYFGGLPLACQLVERDIPEVTAVFAGDETPAECLRLLGIDTRLLPSEIAAGATYDEDRLAFGRNLIQRADYRGIKRVDRKASKGFGTDQETLWDRIHHGTQCGLPPLMRAHVGPYLPDRQSAVKLFFEWTKQLADSGLLDVLSIGTSQLTQSNFGDDWGNRPNGGGVPLNSPEEFAETWRIARPMLVRSYAGTRDVVDLARMFERTIHIAWHALSLWWFSRIDGRGPYSVRDNLQQHLETLRFIASTGKPYEPNVPHHFAFRGADDVTYIVSAVLAARAAKAQGVRTLVLQIMLNTPKATWGIQDLAKARALLQLVREIEDEHFHVFLQPRGGLDYFSPDAEKAKAQLAAVTALMDDIEPHDPTSPPLIHVVSYSEGSHLADPAVVNESIQVTRYALEQYRRLRARGHIDDMAKHPQVTERTAELLSEARTVLESIERTVPAPYSAEGLYNILVQGFLPIPYLWECKDEFPKATAWSTRLMSGSVKVVDAQGRVITARERMRLTTDPL